MRSQELESFYAELVANGFDFEGCATRKTGRTQHGRDIVADFGILKEKSGAGFRVYRLKNVLEIAERRGVYFIIIPEIREIKKRFQSDEDAVSVQPTYEVAACFIHSIAFQDYLRAGYRVVESLKRNFLYLQEDKTLLAWGHLLERTNDELVTFNTRAYDEYRLLDNSKQLRNFLENANQELVKLKEIGAFMEDSTHEKLVKFLSDSMQCIGIICCKGII